MVRWAIGYEHLAAKAFKLSANFAQVRHDHDKSFVESIRWAIEYEHPAAEAFKLNHPRAATFTANCSVVLTRAMLNAGARADCDACEEVHTHTRSPSAHQRTPTHMLIL